MNDQQPGGTYAYGWARPTVTEPAWYAEGRVPGPWRTITVGPYATPQQAGQAARERHLGGVRIYRKENAR